MSNEPQSGVTRTVFRRRRSRRHHRNRRIRRALFVLFCAAFTVGLSSAALRYLTPSLFHISSDSEPSRQSAEASRERLVQTQKNVLRDMEGRTVYPYSVVAGGVRDVKELKWAAEHDPVVAMHYAGFDYDHARVVKLVLARTAYISYRIGNKVYWTRHRVSLKKGETVITDGKITARTRCANRVEEMPQQLTSQLEPPAAKFDQPEFPDLGTALNNPPVPFQSALVNRAPGLGPALPLTSLDPIAGGGWTPIAPPPLPTVCVPGVTKKPGKGTGGGLTPVTGNAKKKKVDPCANGGGGGTEVPEPGTWLLLASGVSAIYWKARQKFSLPWS